MIKIFKPTILVVSPHPQIPGGVTTFIECMKRHITSCSITPFYVGSTGTGSEDAFTIFRRLVTAPIELARLVQRQKISVVHINPSFDKKAVIRDGLILLALRAIGYRRVLCYIHGWDPALYQKISANKYLHSVAAWLMNGVGLITVLSEDFRKDLIALGVHSSRLAVARTMFEGNILLAAQDQPRIHPRRFVLFMSRFDPEKGGRELLQAFAALAPDITDLDLVMAGDGVDADLLRTQAQNMGVAARVFFPGYVRGVEKARWLRDCTIFALPTYYRSEAMPVAVLEAMGAGKILLASSAGAMRNILSDPANGVVLETVTAETVKTGLLRILNDPTFAATAGQTNKDIAWEKFEAKKVTAEIEGYYRRVVEC